MYVLFMFNIEKKSNIVVFYLRSLLTLSAAALTRDEGIIFYCYCSASSANFNMLPDNGRKKNTRFYLGADKDQS